ncbi:hypothetical protein GH714_003534 [Hevea brasiliensis]|uniref:Glycosyltransferase n=1 Tax=Hevea brasiliensis TaxID=3981 RepID=A0A6A6LH31_HEVBR|nr:hypothetical protein GH714_003534 [Hevea brasiliensis]
MEQSSKLHIVAFPWLAMGHLIPFLRFSKILAQRGHKIYFVSTPRNIDRLHRSPQKLSSNISLISFPLPSMPGLPPSAENTSDIPYSKQQLLKKAFDLLEQQLTTFLQSTKPDWVIYDYPSHWLPSIAADLGISTAFFSLFTAAALTFVGPPSMLMHDGDSRSAAEDFTVVPKWVPFESNVMYRIHEVTKYVEKTKEDETGPNDTVRFGFAVGKADLVIIRSSPELEPECGREWAYIKEWLDKKEAESVVYVALGTEGALSQEEVSELAFGLEKSRSPFFWALKSSPGSTQNVLEMLPDGFEERVKHQGIIYKEWAPQVKILGHKSVGVFLTHCGWNSVVEGLSFGRVLIMFPMLNDQGLNARLLQGKNLGLEIPRNQLDGAFTSDSVAELLRKDKIDGSPNTKKIRGLLGDRDRNNQLAAAVVHYLEEGRTSRLQAC